MLSKMTQDELKEFIETEYVHNLKSWGVLAEMLGTYPNKLRRLAKKLGIASRDKSEAQSVSLASGRSSHPTEGRERTAEEKNKIAKAVVENWRNLSDDEMAKISEQRREAWNNLTAEQRLKLHKSAMEGLRKASKDGSRIEQSIRDNLEKDGYVVHFHKSRFVANREFELDIFLPTQNIAIEVDGPSHYLPIWGEKHLQKQVLADKEKNGHLHKYGVKLIRIKYLTKTTSEYVMTEVYNKVLNAIVNMNEQYQEIEV